MSSPDPPAIVQPAPHRPDRPLLGMALRLLAMLFLTSMFTLGKIAADRHVTLVETVFYRQLFAMPVVFAFIALRDGPRAVRTNRIGKHGLRAMMGLLGLACNFGGFILLPLTEATIIGFTMPMFATILAAVVLREATGIHRWSAILVGFAGILVIARPDAGHFAAFGVAVALAAAFLTACISLVIRDLGRTESPGVIVFWFTALSLPPLALLMPFFGHGHDPVTWGLLVLTGVVGAFAQLFLTAALRYAPVSVVLGMDYSSILWATLLGFLLWGEWPMATTWVGAAMIIGAGAYIGWREHIRSRQPNRI